MTEVLLKVEGLKKYFPVGGKFFGGQTAQVKAVDGVDLFIKKGEILGSLKKADGVLRVLF